MDRTDEIRAALLQLGFKCSKKPTLSHIYWHAETTAEIELISNRARNAVELKCYPMCTFIKMDDAVTAESIERLLVEISQCYCRDIYIPKISRE